MELGHGSGPRCQQLPKVRENSYEHQVLLAPRGAGVRTEILGNPTGLTRGAPPTLGTEGKLKSRICPGIRKQHLCASWLGGSEVQQGKHDMGLLALQ